MPTKSKRDKARVKCLECGEWGFYASACPTKGGCEGHQEDIKKKAFQTWDNASHVIYRVEAALNPQKGGEEQLAMYTKLKWMQV